MPTMAVMWVSVPKTWMGIPVVLPEESRQNQLSVFESQQVLADKCTQDMPSHLQRNIIYRNINQCKVRMYNIPTSPITLRPSW